MWTRQGRAWPPSSFQSSKILPFEDWGASFSHVQHQHSHTAGIKHYYYYYCFKWVYRKCSSGVIHLSCCRAAVRCTKTSHTNSMSTSKSHFPLPEGFQSLCHRINCIQQTELTAVSSVLPQERNATTRKWQNKGKTQPPKSLPHHLPCCCCIRKRQAASLRADLSLQQEHRKLAVERAERMTVFGSGFSCLVGFFRLISPLGTLNRSSGQSLNPRSFAVGKKKKKAINWDSSITEAAFWEGLVALRKVLIKTVSKANGISAPSPSACAHTWWGFFQWDFSGSHGLKKKLLSMLPILAISSSVKYVLSDAKNIDSFLSMETLPSTISKTLCTCPTYFIWNIEFQYETNNQELCIFLKIHLQQQIFRILAFPHEFWIRGTSTPNQYFLIALPGRNRIL